MIIVLYLLQLYMWVVLAAVVLSWLPDLRNNPVGHAVERATEPVFAEIRKVLPPIAGIDLTPLAVLLGLRLLMRLLQ